jgi:hypothetical protein
MTLFIEEDVEDTIEADDWAKIIAGTREQQRRELERKMAEFEARGGQVKTVRQGESGVPDSQYLWSFPVGKAADPNPAKREEGVERRKRAQTAAQRRGTDAVRGCKLTDDQLIVIIDQQLGVAKNKKELCAALGCSDNLLQRLLFCHFQHDDRADPYRSVSRADHEAQQVAKIRQLLAEGHTGMSNITKLLGLKQRSIVIKLDQKYGLKIPREEPGKKKTIMCANGLCQTRVSTTARFCPRCGTVTALGLTTRIRQ